MYTPAAFLQDNLDRQFELIESHSFGLLVSTSAEGEPTATHLPMLLDRDAGPQGRILGHLARANPQSRQIDGRQVLGIFAGPHAYISPTWYAAENVVPTWNYVAVHVYGVCRVTDDAAKLTEIVSRYVATYERGMPEAWQLDAGTPYIEKLLKAIVGFEIDIERIEGKWKLGQNQPPERRQRVADCLVQRGEPQAVAIAELMRQTVR